jgi:HSP20 family protein
MNRLQRDMNRLFNSYGPFRLRTAPSYPAVSVWAKEDGQVVNAEMPGVKAEDIDVSVVGDTLTISGKRGPEELPEGARFHRRERVAGEFSRSIQLPFAVDSEKVEASLKDGVLTLNLPRLEADKPKKITIQS